MHKELSAKQREEIVHETIRNPIVSDSIEINVLNCRSLLRLDDTSTQLKILAILNEYAKQVAKIALKYPADAPDVIDQNWKKKFADNCSNAASQGKSMDDFGKMLKKLFAPKLENHQDNFTYRLIATDIFDNVVQVANCLSAGYNPALLLMTPEEHALLQDSLAQSAQESESDVTYMAPGWPH